MDKLDRKNYSLYMCSDFDDKLKKIQDSDPSLKSLSKSQAVYCLISSIADQVDWKVSED